VGVNFADGRINIAISAPARENGTWDAF